MSESVAVELGELTPKIASVNPAKFPEEVFDLLSIPAYDAGSAQIVTGAEVGSNKQLVEPGDVMISKIVPHIRRVWVVPEPSKKGRRQLASGEWIVFRTDRVLNRWLRFYLLSDSFHAQFMNTVAGVGGSLLRARPQFVKKIKLTIPPLAVQEKEAEIEELKAIIQQKRERQQELFEELSVTHHEQHFSQKDKFDWVKLKDVTSKIGSGATPKGGSQAYKPEGIALIRSMNVHDRKFVYDGLAFIDEKQAAALSSVEVKENDILLNITGASVARVCRVPEDVLPARVNQHVAIIRLKPDTIEPELLERYLTLPSIKKQLLKIATSGGATREAITKTSIQHLRVPIL